jgi:hypothetical protein
VQVAPRWIDAAGAAAAPRRRLVAAAFALELAHARRSTGWPFRYPLIVWACDLLRTSPTGLPGERWWYLASVALLEDMGDWEHAVGSTIVRKQGVEPLPPARRRFFSRADQLEYSDGHVTHARKAFPDEVRLQLASAHFAESQTFLPSSGPRGINSQQTSPALLESLDRQQRQPVGLNPDGRPAGPLDIKRILDRVDRIPRVVDQYGALYRHEPIRGDVELRQGFLALRLEAWDDALAHLDNAVATAAEPELVGLGHLFRGWVFEQTGRPEDAITAYRAALAPAPLARTTSILLAAQLTRNGRQDEAYPILDAALKASPMPDAQVFRQHGEPEPALDLWPRYRNGDAVLLTSYVKRMREALR